MEKTVEKSRTLNQKSLDSKSKDDSKSKGTLKMYNTTFHGFGYEHTQKQKRTFVECENSTPSELSDQSFNGTTDVFLAIPLLKQIVSLGECADENMISSEEMIRIFTKLKISQDGSVHPFKYFPFSRQVKTIKVEELVAFLTSDIKKIQLGKYSKEEAVLKIGLEIFRAVGKENIHLEIRNLISYMKEHKKIDIDMTNMLEMFDFFVNANSGILKAKTNVVSFFCRNASKLARSLSLDFMAQIQLFISSKKGTATGASTQTNSISTKKQSTSGKLDIIKIYDPNRKSNPQQPLIIDNAILGDSRQDQSPIKIIRVETHNDDLAQQDFFNLDISEVFNEILPKNRGWLMRKSNKKANKWSMVFYEISNDRLISYKPQVLKKTILVKNLEIHKCNFLEVVNRFENRESTSKGHKRNNSQSKKGNDPKQGKSGLKEDLLFFILDKETQKTYLIKSQDNMIIGSIIHFYLLKENPKKSDNPQLLNFLQNEPEYSGVIEVAICKKKSISKYHSSLKSYSFKKQFLIIKQGKFNVYDMKVKDSINLIEYETKVHNSSDLLIPQTNPHCFSLTKLVDYNPYNFVSPKGKTTLGSFTNEPEVLHTLPDRKKPYSFLSKPKKEETPNNAHYEDLVIIEEKKSGFLSGIFKKLSFGKKKTETIILSCDTELKRRQWILTIGFFTQMAMRTLHRSKQSFTKESVLNTNEDMLRSSIGGEPYTLGDDGKKRNKSKNKNSISIKHKISHNPDLYDVYKNENQEDKNEQLSPDDMRVDGRKPTPNNNPIPLMTEPDAEHNILDSEEVLMTFTHFNPENLPMFLLKQGTLGNKIENYEANLFSNEIRSVSDVEIWQKFIMYFIQENHSVSEFDMANEFPLEKTTTLSRIDIEVAEESDGVIRPIALSDWSIRKNR